MKQRIAGSGVKQRIAVIGAGIAGLSTAWLLRETHDITLFEAAPRAGGHADTQDIELDGKPLAVDTGFIVYNEPNYPHLTALFAELGVATIPTEMSFGVSVGDGALEYGGGQIGQLFAQRRNALRPRFWAMLRDLLRFYRQAPELLHSDTDETLGAWLARHDYADAFVLDHLLPMGAAIWSASVEGMREFPARHFVRFFHNHGLLRLTNRPPWRTVRGGSRNYVAAMLRDLPDARLAASVRHVSRHEDRAVVHLEDGGTHAFDQVVLACHADEALAMIEAPDPTERALLGAVRFQDNLAVLHTDIRLMPRRRGVWSAWNYLSDGATDHAARVSVTYWMNRLQSLETKQPVLVTLNPLREPDPRQVLASFTYRHPQFDAAAMRAQAGLAAIQGQNRLFFAGAWTGWGFHEDGIASAVRVAGALGVQPPWLADARREQAA